MKSLLVERCRKEIKITREDKDYDEWGIPSRFTPPSVEHQKKSGRFTRTEVQIKHNYLYTLQFIFSIWFQDQVLTGFEQGLTLPPSELSKNLRGENMRNSF